MNYIEKQNVRTILVGISMYIKCGKPKDMELLKPVIAIHEFVLHYGLEENEYELLILRSLPEEAYMMYKAISEYVRDQCKGMMLDMPVYDPDDQYR